jgi:iron-sulfur cluster repair protein YtfE (RIC family)
MNTLNWMAEDHHTTIEGLTHLREICYQYQPPGNSPPEMARLFSELRQLDWDYQYHLLLENFYLYRVVARSLNS